jgi:hypothetical protein
MLIYMVQAPKHRPTNDPACWFGLGSGGDPHGAPAVPAVPVTDEIAWRVSTRADWEGWHHDPQFAETRQRLDGLETAS